MYKAYLHVLKSDCHERQKYLRFLFSSNPEFFLRTNSISKLKSYFCSHRKTKNTDQQNRKNSDPQWPFHHPIWKILSLIHISEPTRLGMISYAVFCLKKK